MFRILIRSRMKPHGTMWESVYKRLVVGRILNSLRACRSVKIVKIGAIFRIAYFPVKSTIFAVSNTQNHDILGY